MEQYDPDKLKFPECEEFNESEIPEDGVLLDEVLKRLKSASPESEITDDKIKKSFEKYDKFINKIKDKKKELEEKWSFNLASPSGKKETEKKTALEEEDSDLEDEDITSQSSARINDLLKRENLSFDDIQKQLQFIQKKLDTVNLFSKKHLQNDGLTSFKETKDEINKVLEEFCDLEKQYRPEGEDIAEENTESDYDDDFEELNELQKDVERLCSNADDI